MLRILLLKWILIGLFSNTFAGEIITLSKKSAIKIVKRLKAEKKTPKVQVRKQKRVLYLVIDEDKKKIRTFLKARAAREFASMVRGYRVKKIRALVKNYIISYVDHTEKEVEQEEDSQSYLSLETLPFKLRVINSNNYVHDDYDGNYFELSKGFEAYKGKFSFKSNFTFESYDINGEGDYDKLYPKELFVTYANKGFELTAGPQIRVWGVFDELSELDVLTLKNTSRAYFDDGVNLRRPVNLVHLQKYFGDNKVEAFVNIPIFKGHFSDVNNKYFGIDMDGGRLRGGDLPAAFSSILPNVAIHNVDRDALGYGFRYSFLWGSTDFQIVYSKMQSDVPTAIPSENFLAGVRTNLLSSTALNSGINIKYLDITTFGVAMARQIGGFLFKTELAYKSGWSALTEGFENESMTKYSSNIGGEYELNSINASFRFQINSQMLQNQESLLVDEVSHGLVGEFVKPLMGEKLELKFRYAFELEESGYLLTPSLKYDISDEASIALRAFLFDGDELSDFGFNSKDDLIDIEFNISL